TIEFSGFSGVDHNFIVNCKPFGKCLRRYRYDAVGFKTCCFPCINTSFKIAKAGIKAYTGKPCNRFTFFAFRSNKEQRLVYIPYQGTHPWGKTTMKAYEY